MNIFSIWWVDVIFYLLLAVVYNQSYKIATKKMQRPGAMAVITDLIGGFGVLSLCIFYKISFPSNPLVYLFLAMSITFYAISDRMNATVRKGLPVSTFVITKQLNPVIMVFAGLLFLDEPLAILKILGAFLIVFSNILVLYEKGRLVINKYLIMSLLASISFTTGLLMDVNNSIHFTLPIYISCILLGPAIMIIIFDKVRLKDIKSEFLLGNRRLIVVVGLCYAFTNFLMMRAYQLQTVSTVAPLLSTAVIMNVLAGYIFLKEKSGIVKKIIAAILIILGIILIKG